YLNVDSALYEDGGAAALAALLHKALNLRGNLIPYSFISKETTGKLDDELQPNLERVGILDDEDETFTIYVEKVAGADGSPVWLFSNETIERVSKMNLDVSLPLVERVLPEFLEENKWGGVPVGEWLAMLILGALSYLIS